MLPYAILRDTRTTVMAVHVSTLHHNFGGGLRPCKRPLTIDNPQLNLGYVRGAIASVRMLAPARVSSAGKEDPPVLRLSGARIARHVIPRVSLVQCVGPAPTTIRPIVNLDAREVVCKSREKTSRAANHHTQSNNPVSGCVHTS